MQRYLGRNDLVPGIKCRWILSRCATECCRATANLRISKGEKGLPSFVHFQRGIDETEALLWIAFYVDGVVKVGEAPEYGGHTTALEVLNKVVVNLCDIFHREFDPSATDSNFGDPNGFRDALVAILKVVDSSLYLPDCPFFAFEGKIAGEGVGVDSIDIYVVVYSKVEEFLEIAPGYVGGEEVDVVAAEAAEDDLPVREDAPENLGGFDRDFEILFGGGFSEPKTGGVLFVPNLPVLNLPPILSGETFCEL